MSQITINGKTYFGNSVSVKNGKVTVDGQLYVPDEKQINITIEGNVEKLSIDYCEKIKVTGDVANLTTSSGGVEISGNVTSLSTTSGDVEIDGNVGGSIKTTSGDVKCGNVAGSVTTMSGDIRNKK